MCSVSSRNLSLVKPEVVLFDMLLAVLYTILEAFCFAIALSYSFYAAVGFCTNYKFCRIARQRRPVAAPPPPLPS